jgi:carbamoyl-phosphate synthase small subunit
VIRDLPLLASNFRSERTLDEYLRATGVLGLADIDTRMLTRILREKGAQAGCLMAGEDLDADAAVAKARAFPGLAGMDLAQVVSAKQATPGARASGNSARASPSPTTSGSMSLPTTSASSATSCACWPRAVAS